MKNTKPPQKRMKIVQIEIATVRKQKNDMEEFVESIDDSFASV